MIPLKDDARTRTLPIVTTLLVVVNVLVFLYEMALPPSQLRAFILQMGMVPATLTQGPSPAMAWPVPVTILTSMFLHGGWMHLLGNMLYLWIFGDNIEDEAGHLRFFLFYVVCGFAAALTQTIAAPRSQVPMIGASGAIAGVLGAYMVLFPHARVLTIVPIFFFIRLMYLPALVVLGLWFLYQILLSATALGSSGGGVAFFAHIGGFVTGMILIGLFRKPPARRRWKESPLS